MMLQDLIAQRDNDLSQSDKQVLQQLLANPAIAASLSAAEVAEKVGVHESTVVRVAKKLGYGGYKELRQALRDEIAPAERVRRQLINSTELSDLVAHEIATLQDLVNTIPQADIDQAALMLMGARRVFIFAQGHATALAALMDRRLRRSGFDTVMLTARGRDLAEHVVTLDESDVVLSFAFRTRTTGLSPLLALAGKVGARCILVGDMNGVFVRPQPDMLLVARRGERDQFLSMTVPLVICNALILSIARLDEGRSIAHLDQLSDLIQLFELEDKD